MRIHLWCRLLSWLLGGKRLLLYSFNAMRALHPAGLRDDLERLFGLLASRAVPPHIAERVALDEVAEAHRRLEAGGLDGKLVLCPAPPRRDMCGREVLGTCRQISTVFVDNAVDKKRPKPGRSKKKKIGG